MSRIQKFFNIYDYVIKLLSFLLVVIHFINIVTFVRLSRFLPKYFFYRMKEIQIVRK